MRCMKAVANVKVFKISCQCLSLFELCYCLKIKPHSQKHTLTWNGTSKHRHTHSKNSWACVAKGLCDLWALKKAAHLMPVSVHLIGWPEFLHQKHCTNCHRDNLLRWMTSGITMVWCIFMPLFVCALLHFQNRGERISRYWGALKSFQQVFWWNWSTEIGYVRGYVGNIPVSTHPLSYTHTHACTQARRPKALLWLNMKPYLHHQPDWFKFSQPQSHK